MERWQQLPIKYNFMYFSLATCFFSASLLSLFSLTFLSLLFSGFFFLLFNAVTTYAQLLFVTLSSLLFIFFSSSFLPWWLRDLHINWGYVFSVLYRLKIGAGLSSGGFYYLSVYVMLHNDYDDDCVIRHKSVMCHCWTPLFFSFIYLLCDDALSSLLSLLFLRPMSALSSADVELDIYFQAKYYYLSIVFSSQFSFPSWFFF